MWISRWKFIHIYSKKEMMVFLDKSSHNLLTAMWSNKKPHNNADQSNISGEGGIRTPSAICNWVFLDPNWYNPEQFKNRMNIIYYRFFTLFEAYMVKWGEKTKNLIIVHGKFTFFQLKNDLLIPSFRFSYRVPYLRVLRAVPVLRCS